MQALVSASTSSFKGGLQAALPTIFMAEPTPEEAAAAAAAAAGAKGKGRATLLAGAAGKPPRASGLMKGSPAGASVVGMLETTQSVAQLPPSLSPSPSMYTLQVRTRIWDMRALALLTAFL